MLDTKQFISAIQQIAEEKGIPEDKIVETIEAAVSAAYKKDYGEKGQVIRANLDRTTGEFTIWQVKFVVEGFDEEGYVVGPVPDAGVKEEYEDRSNRQGPDRQVLESEEQSPEDARVRFNPEKYITIDDARGINANINVGEEVTFPLETKTDFGRIAAQTAKQVVIQRLREVEREVVYAEFKNKEGSIISGLVQRIEGRMVYVDIGRTTGLLLPIEQLPNDRYRIGQRLRFLILRVDETNRGPVILLSRSHPDLVLQLFRFEVPEIEAGTVEIRTIAREAGSRSKIAVLSHESGVDPIGSLVGQKGVRVQTVINELSGEKIDIVEWSEDTERFIAQALSPAKILNVKILDEAHHHALVEVADDQFSLAIGKSGQNVRLAAKLTGWKIDVRAPQGEIKSAEAEVVAEGETSVESESAESTKTAKESEVDLETPVSISEGESPDIKTEE